ncbi:E3 ubiquitin-protein ligase RNF34 [Onthophagus taurus]|uniref:E3 ubiquitin-protein ligase RNF34 n=1 Tax=Onthophagus taurus TaxID=166361 RepID=UPI000C20C02B|nr:E3 ubiquitin-protein ligase RNF34 [Onthophagus taurus]
MPCGKCKGDFNLLNWKLKCAECEESFCSKCLKKFDGCFFCEVCFILVQRPSVRDALMELKSRDLQSYLNKHHVPTHGLVEKGDLVDLFIRYHIPVQYKKNHKVKFLNLSGSVPNLAARSQCYLSNIKTNAEAAINQTRNLLTQNQSSPQEQNIPENVFTAHSSPQDNQHPSAPPMEEPTPPPTKKYPKLSDFESEIELNNLSVKELKELLQLNRVNYKGCVEKSDLLQLAVTLWKNDKENKDDGDTFENCCKVCMDAPLDCVLLECGHIATCIDCGKQLAECPICRQYIIRVVRTFKV